MRWFSLNINVVVGYKLYRVKCRLHELSPEILKLFSQSW